MSEMSKEELGKVTEKEFHNKGNRTHNYILKHIYYGGDWRRAHDETLMLMQGSCPQIQDDRTVILTDAYQYVHPDAFNFVRNCFDKKTLRPSDYVPADVTTEDHKNLFTFPLEEDMIPGDQDTILCFWNDKIFHLETYCPIADVIISIDYELVSMEDENTVFLPVFHWFFGIKYGNTQDRLFTEHPFEHYANAKEWLNGFLKNIGHELNFHSADIMIMDKKQLSKDVWYNMENAILRDTNGYSPKFVKNFTPYGKKMYIDLFGRTSYEDLIAQYCD